ncbi:caffeic acid 3-O-methyltransferase-like [Rhododendron vialii]|uniref:caffeic acid 3-O-methyltransferase-like n=1 Tax=Rhododendron vialii TaxID=182163 RepID=UPI00265DD160|nr:caffeic acid 3-O-methyltransferase-like [Rhododendron vialii]
MEPCYRDNRDEDKDDEKQYSYAMEVIRSSVLPLVLKAVIELEALDIIAKEGPGAQLSASEIASRLPPSAAASGRNPDAPEMLDRMLRFLASHSILTCSAAISSSDDPTTTGPAAPVGETRVYGLAPVAKYFVPDQDGVSLGYLLFMSQDKVHINSWYELKGAVLEGGIPFERVHGMHAFEYCGKDVRFNEVFNKAMQCGTKLLIKKIVHSYKGFEQLQSLVDVGGGLGVSLSLITAKYPHIKAINFDLPHVIQQAPPYPGVEHVGGDMFENVPKGDAIFTKRVLHDWSDDQCLQILKNCHKALPEHGKVIVVETILPAIVDTSDAARTAFHIDLLMMTELGGKERTEQEYRTLAVGAGFSGIKLDCYACTLWVMEFYK